MRVHVVMQSQNVKTGPIPVTVTSSDTCPESCPFNGSGCYAQIGPLALHWRKVDAGNRGMDWDSFLDQVESFPKDQLWRMNAAGDLPGKGDKLDIPALFQLVYVNGMAGAKGFTYTHKPLESAEEQAAIHVANLNGFTINLSGNNLAHADALADMGIAPVTVVLPADQMQNTVTPKGRRVVICPAVTRDNVSCATCGLCAIAKRDCIVGFPAHGTAKRKASNIANGN